MAANVYQAVKQAMQDLVAPQIESLRADVNTVAASVNGLRVEVRGDLNALRGELKTDIAGLRSEMHTELASVRGEIATLRGELNGLRAETSANIARLDERLTVALDVRERLVALETRVAR